MLTPRFKLSQDNDHVFITVHAPYTNINDTEVDVDGENFLFVSSPYFLRLRLPGRIVENDYSKGSYCCDSGNFNLTFVKETSGEVFENLDMITSLLAPRDITDINPSLVEMLDDDVCVTVEETSDPEVSNESNKFSYGFANKISTQFSDIGNEYPQIFELRVPEQVSTAERHTLRFKHENNKFSTDHYLADFFDDELVAPYLSAVIFWEDKDFNNAEFNDDEIGILKELPNKHYLISKNEQSEIFFGLLDILFGYCYDKRSTLNESTVESSWTINKLSSTLSWFCTFNDLKQVLIACYRRALIYPIFRNFELCNKVKQDLVSLIRKGKVFVIKCVIEIHQLFNASNDARYILNQLYIKDYLIFLQKCRKEELVQLYNNIANIEIAKDDLGLELLELEEAARIIQQEEADIMENEMAVKLASMSLLPDLKKKNNQYVLESDDETVTSSDSSSDSSSDDSSELDSDDEPPSPCYS